MKADHSKNILFVLYLLSVLVLAVIYFTVPERTEFIEFNIRWWKEFFGVLGALTHS